MLRNFVSCHLMTENEEAEVLSYFEKYPNLVFDADGDYTKSMKSATIIISDYSSLLMHSLLMGVPVIYTGKTSNFNRYIKKTEEGMYLVSNENRLFDTLEMLLQGNDILADKREKVKKLLTDEEYRAGKLILDFLIKDYQKLYNH